ARDLKHTPLGRHADHLVIGRVFDLQAVAVAYGHRAEAGSLRGRKPRDEVHGHSHMSFSLVLSCPASQAVVFPTRSRGRSTRSVDPPGTSGTRWCSAMTGRPAHQTCALTRPTRRAHPLQGVSSKMRPCLTPYLLSFMACNICAALRARCRLASEPLAPLGPKSVVVSAWYYGVKFWTYFWSAPLTPCAHRSEPMVEALA